MPRCSDSSCGLFQQKKDDSRLKSGVSSAVREHVGSSMNSIEGSTAIPHDGCRPPKTRRV